jgi:2-aminoethylphosphonate-pyruvate transaminase
VLSSFKLPASIDYTTLHDGLKGRGFIIYGGQGKLAKSIFRIAVMGAIDSADIERLLAAIATVLQ